MDEDFYIEETSPIKVIIAIIVFVGLIAGSIYYYINYVKETKVKLNNITVELGDKLPTDIKKYITCNNPETYKLDISSVLVNEAGITTSTGEYSYKIIKDSQVLKGKLYVKDTKKPDVEVTELTVGVNESFLPIDFVKTCSDLSMPCTAKYEKISDEDLNKKEGNYKFNIIITDNENNSITKEVSLIVKGENTLYKKKAADLEIDSISTNDAEWDHTFTVKLSEAVPEDSIKFKEIYDDVLLKEYTFDKKETGRDIIIVYNKYNFVIGISIKITFEDNSFIYITESNAVEKESQDNN